MLTKEQENQLAKMVQKGFPLVRRPFWELANRLKVSPYEIMQTIENWQNTGYLREISAVMEGEVLHYESALVCSRIDPEDLKWVTEILKLHPTITHLYLRNYEINLWFTIAVPVHSGIQTHLKYLTDLTHYPYYPLKRTRTFKIGVNFDLLKKTNRTEKTQIKQNLQGFPEEQLTEKIKQIIRAVQTPLPITEYPFEVLARQFSLKEKEILEFLIQSPYGSVRKYVATFNHRKLGVSYNAMTVWRVPEPLLEETGNRLAEFPEISHCYARTTLPEFPYNLYSMIHGPDENMVRQRIDEISRNIGISDFLILYSPIEYKKTRLRYFLKELEEWEQKIKFKEYEIQKYA